eukprot:SAG11_NODE_2381_length_3426_cov_2.697507_1_plen_93_part_00
MVDLDLDLLLLNLVTHEGSKGTNTHLNVVPACLYLRCAAARGVEISKIYCTISCTVVCDYVLYIQNLAESYFTSQVYTRWRRKYLVPRYYLN